MSVSRCLQLCTRVKVCWESLTQFPPPSPCVVCTAAAIEGNLPRTSDTVKNEANDNFADCLFGREMEAIVSVWIFMFLPSFMLLRHAANGNSGFVYRFCNTLVFFRSSRVVWEHWAITWTPFWGLYRGYSKGLHTVWSHPGTAAWQVVGLLEEIRLSGFFFPGSPIAPRTNSP